MPVENDTGRDRVVLKISGQGQVERSATSMNFFDLEMRQGCIEGAANLETFQRQLAVEDVRRVDRNIFSGPICGQRGESAVVGKREGAVP